MKISHSNDCIPSLARTEVAGPGRFACDSLLWIGDTESPSVVLAWRECQRLCDMIAIRRSMTESLATPPRQRPSHIVIAQTNRHDRDILAVDGPDLPRLREQFRNAEMLVLRGALVAPTVRLPHAANSLSITAQSPTPAVRAVGSLDGAGSPDGRGWIDSVSLSEAPSYLQHWLVRLAAEKRREAACNSEKGRNRAAAMRPEATASARRLLPVIVVAAQYELTEGLIDSLSMVWDGSALGEPLIQWQRSLSPQSSRGFATVVWDESVAGPESVCQWQHRRAIAPHARHVWITGMATPQQRAIALAQGVAQVLDKPGRFECLLASLRVA